jgi:hypothetical protein
VTVHFLTPVLAVQAQKGCDWLGCLEDGNNNNPRNFCNKESYEQSIQAKVTSADFS